MTRLISRLPLLALGCALAISAVQTARASNPDQVNQLRSTKKCPGCDLGSADLSGANLSGADLSGANLEGSTLYKADLSHANLTDAVLNNANLKGANLRGAFGVVIANAETDAQTTCPGGAAGPCS